MAKVELVMPKMGESIMEATILNWVKNVGDKLEEDETILEIATDKVDSEIPSPVDGVLVEILRQVNDVVPVGEVIAILETEGEVESTPSIPQQAQVAEPAAAFATSVASAPEAAPIVSAPKAAPIVSAPEAAPIASAPEAAPIASAPEAVPIASAPKAVLVSDEVPFVPSKNGNGAIPSNNKGKFYSPLVRSISNKENVSLAELDSINGSGKGGRVTKKDLLNYIDQRGSKSIPQVATTVAAPAVAAASISAAQPTQNIASSGSDEIIEMDRMRKMIADHMVRSKHTSPHVTSFVEADVTNLVEWRNSVKHGFVEKYGEKITFTPIFIEAVVKAIQDFPMINVSVDGTKIIKKKNINIGMATALPTGNLIVPVIKNANGFNLVGLTQQVNGLANKARNNKLKPEDIQDGTFTVTNVGTFGNVMGTPIINQPQAAILALGAIRKKPAVLETEHGDVIAIRQMMFLSLSYDHRIVDGFLGGSFLRKVADYLEAFDKSQTI